VEEISLSGFAAGHAVGVIAGVPQKFDAREVVRRARSRLGEDRYRLLTNNCEHFCEWCLQGERRSYQIEACLELPSRALLATERLMISIGECVSAFGKGVLNWGWRTDRHLHLPRRFAVPLAIARIVQHDVSLEPIRDGRDHLLRLAATIDEGWRSTTDVLERFGSAARGDRIYRAGHALGQLLRTADRLVASAA
jgi:hypothetical protein